MPLLNDLHAFVVVAVALINALLGFGLSLGPLDVDAIPRFPAIRVMDRLNVRKGCLLTILTGFASVAAFSNLVRKFAGIKGGDVAVEDVSSHPIVVTTVDFHRNVGTNLVIIVGNESLHRLGTNLSCIAQTTPSTGAVPTIHKVSFQDDLSQFFQNFRVAFHHHEARLEEGGVVSRNDLLIVACDKGFDPLGELDFVGELGNDLLLGSQLCGTVGWFQ